MSSHENMQPITGDGTPLISTELLAGLLDHPSVKIFDVRGTWSAPARALPEDYEAGHIDGAIFLDWTRHFIEQNVPLGLAAVSDETGAEAAFRALGINAGDLVVLYDDYSHMFAGRLWWAMRFWGFENVRVLNGGWKYWQNQGLPISRTASSPGYGTFQPQMQANLIVSLDDFLTIREACCVIDGRGAKNFAGNPDDPRTGHIPNTINVPYGAVLNPETGLFLENHTLSAIFDTHTPEWRETPIITSCGSGYAATVILLALSRLNQTARLFDGSFAVWKQDPNRPIEQSEPARKFTPPQ